MSSSGNIFPLNFAEPIEVRKRSWRWPIILTGVVTVLVVASLVTFFSVKHATKTEIKDATTVAIFGEATTSHPFNRPTSKPTLRPTLGPTFRPTDGLTEGPTLPPVTEAREPLSEKAKKVLSEIATNIDAAVDPCDDFYEYACGNFRTKYPLLKNKSEINYHSLQKDQAHRQVLSRLNGPQLTSDATIAPQKYLKHVWDSCVSDKSSTSVQMDKLTEYLDQLHELGSWESKFEKMTMDGYEVLFSVRATIHPMAFNGLIIGPPKFEFADAHSRGEFDSLVDFYSKLILLYNKELEEEKVLELAKEIVDFEHSLWAKATPEIERPSGQFVSYLKVDDLDQGTSMTWQPLIDKMFAFAESKLGDLSFVYGPDFVETLTDDAQYIRNFGKVIEEKSDIETFMANYFKFAVVRQSCFFLGKECRDLHFKVTQKLNKVDRQEYEEENCFRFVHKNLPDVLFSLLQPNARSDEKLQSDHIESVSEQVEAQLKHLIKQISWMDKRTGDVALLNFRWSTVDVNVPDSKVFLSSLEDKYEQLPHVTSAERLDIFDYFKSITGYTRNEEFKTLHGYPEWRGSLFDVLPTLVQHEKTLYGPPFLARSAFFSPELPPEVQLGLLGSILGHKMTHVFDGLANRFNRKYESKDPFWSEWTLQEFKKKMQCMVDAYESQDVVLNGQLSDLKIDGSATLDENLADLIGVKMAFDLLKNKREGPLDTSELPHQLKDMDEEKLFFLSYANVHCSNDVRPDPAEWKVNTCSPRRNRVNVPLAQSKQFALTFRCKSSAKMNPVKRCSFT